jgi:hypothetical protein
MSYVNFSKNMKLIMMNGMFGIDELPAFAFFCLRLNC